jgi:tRNA/tmRNA/rRNA uracil-C5-methylase (TrmA/RlmC/RlmD family)
MQRYDNRQRRVCLKGNDYIYEEMEGLKFKIGPKSFYQTNSEQAYNLYKITRNFAQLTGNELVYDLYTGTGTMPISLQARPNRLLVLNMFLRLLKMLR